MVAIYSDTSNYLIEEIRKAGQQAIYRKAVPECSVEPDIFIAPPLYIRNIKTSLEYVIDELSDSVDDYLISSKSENIFLQTESNVRYKKLDFSEIDALLEVEVVEPANWVETEYLLNELLENDEYDDDFLPPSMEAAHAAHDLLREVSTSLGNAFPLPRISTTGDGSLSLNWRNGLDKVVVTIYSNGWIRLFQKNSEGKFVGKEATSRALINALLFPNEEITSV